VERGAGIDGRPIRGLEVNKRRAGNYYETLQDFTSVSSDFYPELGSHYREAMEDWYLGREGEGARLNVDP
jgi:hypothetical protein